MKRRSKNIRFTGNKSITLPVQRINLKSNFPDSRSSIKRNELKWVGEITPTILSRTYTVQIIFKLSKSPKIRILKPVLNIPEGEELPHVYYDGSLCLYYPKWKEWDSTMLLVDTIVPWISEWLFHYEIWLSTGKWCGGGKHTDRKLI